MVQRVSTSGEPNKPGQKASDCSIMLIETELKRVLFDDPFLALLLQMMEMSLMKHALASEHPVGAEWNSLGLHGTCTEMNPRLELV